MKKLQTKFLVFIILPVLGIVIVTGVLSFLAARHILIDEMKKAAAIAVQQATDKLETGAWRGIQALLVLMAVEQTAKLDDLQLKRLFEQVHRELPVEAVFMGFSDGRFVSSVDKEGMPQDYDPRKRPWYERALKSDKPVVTPLRVSKISWSPVITISAKITDAQGRVKGVLGYNVPLRAIQEKMAEMAALQEYHGTLFSLFTNDGRYIVSSDPERLGTRLGDSTDDIQRRMWRAVEEGKSSWQSIGTSQGSYWYAGIQRTTLGEFYVALEIPLNQAVAPVITLSAVQFGLGLTAVVVLSLILVKIAKKIVRPINMLSVAAARLSRGDYDQKLPVVTHDELGSLTEAFNTMAEGLRQRDFIRDTFGRYLTQEVVDRLLESEDGLTLGGDSRDVSILMSDVRGFTAHTADMPSDRVLLLLNRYLGKMVEILLDHDAIVDEMVGDGILAVFGAPAPMEDHPARAVACALEMQAAMQSINSMNDSDGLPRLEMGIGINTGNVVVGNIGSERRTKYGVVGAEVNFAGRIESYTVGGQILISSSTFQRVGEIVDVRDVVNVEMKGFQRSVSLYDIRAIGHPYNVRLPETLESPAPIQQKIRVMVARLHDKVVTESDESAWITHLSENAAVLIWSEGLEERSEIKIDLLNDDGVSMAGQVFAKVLSCRACGERNEVVVRFTFVSPEIRRFFRQWLYRS